MVEVGSDWRLLAFAGSESGMREAREIGSGTERMAQAKGSQTPKSAKEVGLILLIGNAWLGTC